MNARKLLDWRKLLIYVHRWMGIVFGIIFIVWFISGVVFMYVGMPHLSARERDGHRKPLDLSTARVTPAEAARTLGLDSGRPQIEMYYDGRPIYRFGAAKKVYADTGEIVPGATAEQAVEIIRKWVPEYASTVRYDSILQDSDQWTLYNEHRAVMPLHKIAVGDAAGTYYYVSEQSGEPTMRTDRTSRFWGFWSGVLHWTYFTVLRRNGALWGDLVAWGAIIGTVMGIIGIVIGIWRLGLKRRYRLRTGPSISPYAGWMWWHYWAGLIFGVVTCTWALSGALSLGPFAFLRGSPAPPELRTALAGSPVDLKELTTDRLRAVLKAITPSFTPRELEFLQFRGEPYYIGYRPLPPYDYHEEAGSNEERYESIREHLIVSAIAPERGAFRRFSDDTMLKIAQEAMPGVKMVDEVWLDQYDSYYYDTNNLRSLPVLRVRYADNSGTWLYLNPHQGTMTRVDLRNRWNRWLYRGLHFFDFPFLTQHRPLWDIVVIGLSLGGIALTITSFLPAWRRLVRHAGRFRKSVARARSRPEVPVSGD